MHDRVLCPLSRTTFCRSGGSLSSAALFIAYPVISQPKNVIRGQQIFRDRVFLEPDGALQAAWADNRPPGVRKSVQELVRQSE
jgi:hypothetical protein